MLWPGLEMRSHTKEGVGDRDTAAEGDCAELQSWFDFADARRDTALMDYVDGLMQDPGECYR